MEKIYRILLIAVLAVGILFGLQYFLPITAQYLNVKGVSGIPGLPSMPTVAYQATVEPLPVITLQSPIYTQIASFITALPIPAGTSTFTVTPTIAPGATASNTFTPTATLTLRPGTTAVRTATPTATTHIAITTSTSTSTSTRTPTPTPSATSVQSSSQPCDNVLYPVRVGQTWLYQINAQGHSTQAVMVVAAVSGQTGKVDLFNQASGAFSESLVTCSNGAILNFPSILGFLLFSDGTGAMNVQYVSGLLAPSQTTFENSNWNTSWSGQYRLSGQLSVPFQGQTITVIMNDSVLTLNCHTAGFEPVSVTAGSAAQALKVICSASSPVTLTVNGSNVSGTVSGQTTQWFALHTGLLKLHVDSTSFNVVGLSLPVNVAGSVELLRLQAAP